MDFRDSGSDEDDELDSDSVDGLKKPTEPVTSDSGLIEPCAETLVESHGQSDFEQIISAQIWETRYTPFNQNVNQPRDRLTESQLVREVIFMLFGTPTSIYAHNQEGKIELSQSMNLRHASTESLIALLESFAKVGENLTHIRRWIRRTTDTPLEQTFQASLASRLHEIDRSLTTVQSRLIDPQATNTPSLLHLYDEISKSCRLAQQVTKSYGIWKEFPRPIYQSEYWKICLIYQAPINWLVIPADMSTWQDCFSTVFTPI